MSIIYDFKTEIKQHNTYSNSSENNNNQYTQKMFWDKTDNHVKAIDNNGNVSNNFLIEQAIPVSSNPIIILLAVIVFLHLLNLIFKLYQSKRRELKKRYKSRSDVNAVNHTINV